MSGDGGRARARRVSDLTDGATEPCHRFEALFRARAFDALIEEAQGEIQRVVSRFTGLTAEDREDAVQYTSALLFAEWKRGKTYGRHPILTVIRRRAGWTVRELAAHAGRIRNSEISADACTAHRDHGGTEPSQHPEWIDRGPSAAEKMLDREAVGMALAGLTDKEREVTCLRCLLGLSSDQAAERLGILPNAVDQTYFRARKKMKESLRDYWGTPAG